MGRYAEGRWQTQMRHERGPSVDASYRCSLALPDEAFSQDTYLLPGLNERDDLLSYVPEGEVRQRALIRAEICGERNIYPSLSSRSLGIVISSTRSMRLLADSSSNEMDERFRHCSREGSARNVPSNASSLITG